MPSSKPFAVPGQGQPGQQPPQGQSPAIQVPKPVAPAPPQSQTQQAAGFDPFASIFPNAQDDSEIPTSGVPLKEGFEMGLKGSEFFGTPPPTNASPEAEASAFDPFAPLPTETEAAEEGADEDWNDEGDGDEDDTQPTPVQTQSETVAPTPQASDPFAAAFATPPQTQTPPISLVPLPQAQTPKPKAFQIMRENATIEFDTKLVADLSSVKAAKDFWEKSYKPFADMSKEEAYTRNEAGNILMRDREERMRGARLLAEALGKDEDFRELSEDEVEVTMTLGKDEAQAHQSDLGRLPQNPMMNECGNRMVGCNSKRLNHLQGTGQCVAPDCPCKGRCQSYVEKGQGGGEATQGTTKSGSVVHPSQLGASSASSVLPKQGANAGSNVLNAPIPASAGQPAQARGISQPTPAQAGGQGTGGNQNPGATQQVSTQVGVSPAERPQGVGIPTAAQGQGGQPQASNQAGVQRADAENTREEQVARAATQAQFTQEEEPIITGDLLGWIVKTGGRDPSHSDYWPSMANTDQSEVAISRRDYISDRFVKFWEKATLKQQGTAFVLNTDEFDLKSTSYRVVLAANRVAAAIEAYAVAPMQQGYNEQADATLTTSVGMAAEAYVNAHRKLAPHETDCTWEEYLEYCAVFADSGMKQGMLIHEYEKEAQTQK